MDELKVRVRSITEITRVIRAYELVAEKRGGLLPAFTPGAHVTVTLPSGARRAYSLYNSPTETGRYRIAVQREDAGRGGSAEMHRAVQVDDVISVATPRNLFALVEAPKSLLIAGGIGVTPILSMAQSLVEAGKDAELVYLARDEEDAPFLEDIAALTAKGLASRLHFDGGERARAYDLHALLATLSPHAHVYCCGPEGLMKAVEAAAQKTPIHSLHFERFINPDAEPRPGDRGFVVRLARSGRSIEVGPDETVLEALLSKGIDVDYSCREGTCGTCIARVLSGRVEHRDKLLSASERETHILICCSRATTPELTLDL